MNRIQVLENARKLLSAKSRWTQGVEAVDKDGKACEPKSPKACQWCAVGAIYSCSNNRKQALSIMDICDYVVRYGIDVYTTYDDVVSVNDDYLTTNKDITKIFTKTINFLKKNPNFTQKNTLED